MGLIEIGQPQVTLMTIVVGQQPIHRGIGGSRAKDQIRPVDSFIWVTMVHQPAGSLTTKPQVQGVALKLAIELVETALILADLLHLRALRVGLRFLAQQSQEPHALFAVTEVEGINLDRPIEISQSGLMVAANDLSPRSSAQHHRILGRYRHCPVEVTHRRVLLAHFQGVLARAKVASRIVGLTSQVGFVRLGRLDVAVIHPELVSHPQPCLVEGRIALYAPRGNLR